jgi:hypothetical protein
MIPVKAPTFSWQETIFVCPTCGGQVQFELRDFANKSMGTPRLDEFLGWEVSNARCCFCNTLGRFTEADPSDD